MFDVRGPGTCGRPTGDGGKRGNNSEAWCSKSGKHLARGCLFLPVCFQRKQRPSFFLGALRFSVLVLRSFKCPLWWPWGCSEEGRQFRKSRCRVDPCNNLVKTRTPKAVNGDSRQSEPWPSFLLGRFLYTRCFFPSSSSSSSSSSSPSPSSSSLNCRLLVTFKPKLCRKHLPGIPPNAPNCI